LINSQIEGVKFIKLDADLEVKVERWLERNTRIIEVSGSTMAAAWKMPMNAEARKKYGEEYSEDVYRKQAREEVFGIDMVKIEHSPEKN
jgi:hypothetical protein